MEPLTQDVSMPNLLYLTTWEVMDFPWDRITAPQLRSLTVDDDPSHVILFLSWHPSIRNLDLYGIVTAEDFRSLAIHAAQLNVLDIEGHIGGRFRPIDPELSFLPFPELTDLSIAEGAYYTMCTQDLEDFVKARCLQTSEHKGVSLISTLTISGGVW